MFRNQQHLESKMKLYYLMLDLTFLEVSSLNEENFFNSLSETGKRF